MLQNIRDNIQGVAAKIIIGLMIVPFALYGIDFLFSGSSDTPVAVVNGEKVSQFELDQALAMQKRQLLAMMGNNIDPGLLDDAVLRRPALDSLIRQKVLLQAADEAGIAVPDSVLNQAIMQMPQFQEGGRFSSERFRQILAAQGFTPQLFRSLLRTDLLIDQLNQGVAGSTFITDVQESAAIRLGDQKRSFHYLTLDTQKFAEQISPSDEAIEAYYRENESRFKSPESVRVAYLELKIEDFYEPVAEEDIRAAYQQELEAANERTERRAAHILVEGAGDDAKAKLAEAQERIRSGESFADVAKDISDDFGSAEQGGDLGFSAGDTFPEAFESALSELEVGEVSEPVETDAGLHLVKLLEVRVPDVASLESRRADIERQLQVRAAKPRLISEVEALRDLVFNADGLDEPAKTLDLEVKQSDWLTPDQNKGLLEHPAVKAAAFNVDLREQGYNSEVIEVSPSNFVVLHPLDYKAPEVRPLEEVRDTIVASLKQQGGRELAEAAADELMASLSNGDSAESLAKKTEGVEWQVAVRASRQDSSIGEAIRRKVFQMARPEEGASGNVAETSDASGNLVVIQLTNVYDGERSLVAENRRRELLAGAQRVQANQSYNAYFASLMSRAEVKYN
ncbi:peptidyl-prolyl cis-trans isomerase D [Litorivivens lipolytica]|uniref:Periplasmic chaperone PpiD n=1 Tax=Litorivivens lipolytica TaxID=1524264 RepID=A0A7W4W311_9GAMM|nr:SurA N-terminal domain-containing protein [Litorivivens lipolytica]MBB3046523.1 peptidyl-prolyl cis-trans isomerase D [Litorivivens lipolytica]